jgi:hypothetical protein
VTLAVLMLSVGAASAGFEVLNVDEHLNVAMPSTPNEWTACSIQFTATPEGRWPWRPETVDGENVYVLKLCDPHDCLEIPWPRGMTATEAVRVWNGR